MKNVPDSKLGNLYREHINLILNKDIKGLLNQYSKDSVLISSFEKAPKYFRGHKELEEHFSSDGFKVHEAVPIQYSLFRLDKYKNIEHFEYIQEYHSEKITSGIMDSLRNNLLNAGTIICWNKSFEIGRLKKLGELHPENKDYIDSIIMLVQAQVQ